MSARKLRWLGLLGFLGLLGIPLRMGELYALFAFHVFLGFWPVVDERAEANLGRAAAFAYLATLVTTVACFVGVIPFIKGAESGIRFSALALSLMVIFIVHVLSFAGSYAYFDRRGG